jgi:hypothetical protein
VITDQSNTGITQASKFTAYGNAYLSSTVATASANNLSATNEGPLLDVTSQPVQRRLCAGSGRGDLLRVRRGPGRRAWGRQFRPGRQLWPGARARQLQTNEGGGVEVIASLDGNTGYDAVASSTAMGNAVTGYVCSDCSGKMTVNNNQTNSADIGARTTVSVTNSGRSVVGVSTATGNNASFYVSSPNSN